LTNSGFTFPARIAALRATKLAQTREKQQLIGSMNHDDWALILPPPERREVVQTMSASGMPITDILLKGFQPKPNHPSGGFFGPRAVGENFRALLECHPSYVDPNSSLAGAYMANFMSFRKPHWNPELCFDPLHEAQRRYQLVTGIGGVQHFCQDLAIGLQLGWGGLLEKVRRHCDDTGRGTRDREGEAPAEPPRMPPSGSAGASASPPASREELYAGLEHVVLGVRNWIGRTASAAREMAQAEPDPDTRQNLEEIAEINERLVTEPPQTFREACQWILWYQITARMFNGSGSLGRLDVLLAPFYERDKTLGRLTDEEATFHVACLLLRDTAYIQLGGPDASGQDATNPVSFLVLEAAHRLKIPANVGVCVGDGVDPRLLRRGVEILLADKTGIPKFLGVENTARGFARNGFPMELAWTRAYSGCHWSAIPGREYTLNDCVKINLAAVFDVALREMMAGEPLDTLPRAPKPAGGAAVPSRGFPIPREGKPGKGAARQIVAELWTRFEAHLRRAVETIVGGLAFHLEHMHAVFPELVLDLLCHGPIEKGIDASHGGVEFYNLCLDGAALATVADSFAAIEQRVEREQLLSWDELMRHLDSDWAGPDGEQARLMMRSVPRYGSGGSRADELAQRIAQTFARIVKETPTPGFQGWGATLKPAAEGGRLERAEARRTFVMIPGLFSWANTIPMGKALGATPNGRRAGEPISHGANPDPGFRKDGAPTALAVAIAAVQPGYGNTAPMQIELDPLLASQEEAVDRVAELIKTHFDLGGTQVNINVLDRETLLDAHEDPTKYPDLVVRVTGFSAYFASLSPEFRQLVVDRLITAG